MLRGPKSPAAVKSTWARFIAATPTAAANRRSHADGAPSQAPNHCQRAGLTADPADGQIQAAALKHAKLPVYFPRLIVGELGLLLER